MTVELSPAPSSAGAEAFSVGRVLVLTGSLVVVGAAAELLLARSWRGALSLTAAGGVAMINFRWSGALLERMLQPGGPRMSRPVVWRIALKLVFLGGGLIVLLAVPGARPEAVALGVTALVVALLAESVRWAVKGGG